MATLPYPLRTFCHMATLPYPLRTFRPHYSICCRRFGPLYAVICVLAILPYLLQTFRPNCLSTTDVSDTTPNLQKPFRTQDRICKSRFGNKSESAKAVSDARPNLPQPPSTTLSNRLVPFRPQAFQPCCLSGHTLSVKSFRSCVFFFLL